jgi:hypothetical protein
MSELKAIYELLETIREEHKNKINSELSLETLASIEMLLNDLNTIIVWNNNNKKLDW